MPDIDYQELERRLIEAIHWAKQQGYEIVRGKFGALQHNGNCWYIDGPICPLSALLAKEQPQETDMDRALALLCGDDTTVQMIWLGVDCPVWQISTLERKHPALLIGQRLKKMLTENDDE